MEKSLQPNESREPSKSYRPTSVMQVNGRYQIHEFQMIDGEKKLNLLPLIAKIIQTPNHVLINIYNEIDGTTRILNYPMNGAAYWNEDMQCFVFSRAVDDTLVADFITAPENSDRHLIATYRITWKAEGRGRIQEICEDFDADGKRMDSSLGHNRTLVPIPEA